MVRGLERFRRHFAGLEECFVIIGGSACDLWLQGRGLGFRRTRDIDLVLIAERLTPAFSARFRAFVVAGGYEHVARPSGRRVYYRFSKPTGTDFPEMIELFSRRPARLALVPQAQRARMVVEDTMTSLSAILMDDAYYGLVLQYRTVEAGLPGVSPGALIPLKAFAWLDLRRRKAAGESVDEDDIRKHRNDVFRLVLSLAPTERFAVPEAVRSHLCEFLQGLPAGAAAWQDVLRALRSGTASLRSPEDLRHALAAAFDVET